jgi:signal transduction histidine kinase
MTSVTEARTPGDRDGAGRASPAPVAAQPWNGVLLFAPGGDLIAATAGDPVLAGAPVTRIEDVEGRYRQSDGMPINLRRRGRHVGIPINGRGPRLMIVSEPLVSRDGNREEPLAVSIDPFSGENDPATVQRALGSVLAHELRTPLTTVYGGAELLTRHGLPDATRREAARSVATAAEQLHRVIEDLVVLVRWQGERSDDAEPVLLQPILRAEVDRFGSDAVRVDLRVEERLPPVTAVGGAVEHIVRNVLVHAVANTPPTGRVVVDARASGSWIEIHVTDAGPALSSEERERAFDLFGRASRTGGDPSGANLALVTARRLTERVGGRIQAGSPDAGAETIVRLPAAVE